MFKELDFLIRKRKTKKNDQEIIKTKWPDKYENELSRF